MAITQAMTNSFKVDILSGGHNFNTVNRALTANTQDAFKFALYTSSATLDATTTAYSATNEIAGTGYTAAGAAISIIQVPSSAGAPSTTAFVDFADTSWSSATFTANGGLIYNVTNANKSCGAVAFGGDKQVTSGTFTVQWPVPATGSSIIQIA